MPTYHETTLSQLPQLLEILLAHLPEELRLPRMELTLRLCEQEWESGRDSRQHERTRHEIFHFTRNGEMIGGAFSMLRADGTVLAIQPAVVPTEPESSLRLVYETLVEFSVAEDARLIMLLVDFQQSADETLLDAFEFEKISELLNLNAERLVFPERLPNGRLSFRPYKNEQWREMVATVEKTYENTLDFPRLTGLVPPDKILQGYQESHAFDPSLWYFIEFRSQIIGVLLLTQIENGEHLELTYVGLAPEFRGQGFSREIVRFSQFIARERNNSHLLVSVDVSNTPALTTYLRCDFHVHDRKEIYVRFF